MLEVVAVEDVPAAPPLEADGHAHGPALEADGVLPPGVAGARRTAVAREDLEVDQVHVEGVRRIGAYLPDLRRAQPWPGVDAPWVEDLAVYGGHPAEDASDEPEPARYLDVGGVREVEVRRELIWQGALLLLPAGHDEAQDVPRLPLAAQVL